MDLKEWIDFGTIKTLSHHLSGIVAAILFYRVIGLALDFAVEEEPYHTVFAVTDVAILYVLLLWLIYQMACVLWNQRVIIRKRGVENVESLFILAA